MAAPDSRAAAELAVYLGVISGINSGCMSCGGAELGELPTIVWQGTFSAAAPVHGTVGVGGVAFAAAYEDGKGWAVSFQAC